MITANDGSWVDKEARFRLSVDQFRYNATPTFIVANSAGNCECGVSGTVQYQCTTTQDVLGSYDCRLNLGFCQFRVTDPLPNPNSWFVIVTYPPQAQANLNQVVPMSILITRFNVQRTPTPMTITTTSCNYAARAPSILFLLPLTLLLSSEVIFCFFLLC